MFKNIEDAIAYVESKRTKRTFLMFQETIKKYYPDYQYPFIIHVAGTNGKGSTTMMIKDLLVNHGYHVGTFTSPYIICHNERIQIDGQMIPNDDLFNIINELYPMIESEGLSAFEIDICIMLSYFKKHSLDYWIVECGIGGLEDKTNVLETKCRVISHIGYDHQAMLGDRLLDIAAHKIGIVKDRYPLFTTEKNPEILSLFQQHCHHYQSKMTVVKTPEKLDYPYRFSFHQHNYTLKDCGRYQVDNALLALSVVDSLITLDDNKIQSVFDCFTWPGRFEKVAGIYLDGAHNQDGIWALIQSLKDRSMNDVGIVFSALDDKDVLGMLDLLSNYDCMFASFEDDRFHRQAIDFMDAIELMKTKHQDVVVTGSLHFISAVRKELLKKAK